MMQIDGTFVPQRSTVVAAVELDGEAVLYHEHAGTIHVLNPAATIIWGQLDGSTDVNVVVGALAAAFSVDSEVMRADVMRAIQDFGAQGLLEGVEPDPEIVASNALVVPGTPGQAP